MTGLRALIRPLLAVSYDATPDPGCMCRPWQHVIMVPTSSAFTIKGRTIVTLSATATRWLTGESNWALPGHCRAAGQPKRT